MVDYRRLGKITVLLAAAGGAGLVFSEASSRIRKEIKRETKKELNGA